MTSRLGVVVGGVELPNPVICGSGEHLIEPSGVRAAIAAGAGAVVVKSANESEPARRQLAHTDYALYDAQWRRLPWNHDPPPGAHLLNRSGLHPRSFSDWLDGTAALIAEADQDPGGALVVPSIIPADPEVAIDLIASTVEVTACRAIEINVGAPHGREAAPGNIALETEAARIAELTASYRRAVDAAARPVAMWVKLTGQADRVDQLAAAAFDAGADAVTLMGRFMAFLPDVETQSPALGTMAAFGGGWALPLTCRWLALARALCGADRCLVATNGARTGLDVARFLLAGASAVQMNTAVFTGGFDVITSAVAELDHYLAERGDTAAGIVGRAADRLEAYTDQPADAELWRRFVPPPAAEGERR